MNGVGGGIFERTKQQYHIINDEQWKIYCSTARAFGGKGMRGSRGLAKGLTEGYNTLRMRPPRGKYNFALAYKNEKKIYSEHEYHCRRLKRFAFPPSNRRGNDL